MEADYASLAQLVGFLMLSAIVAFLESLCAYHILWRQELSRLWEAEAASGLAVRKGRDRVVLVTILFVIGITSALFAWTVWRMSDPPELVPALIALLAWNGFSPLILIMLYLSHRQAEQF